ncbi:MAG: hypothetical protein LBT48_05415 [Prevotellaceae bacterium]|jgi:hypothetical protein|nr:hypothetical protein [Prevotellaceae bacterium]
MKKNVLFIGLAVVLTACADKYYTEEYYTTVDSHSIEVTLDRGTARWWESGFDALGYRYFYYTVYVPELTDIVLNEGVLNTYLAYVPEGTDMEALSPLPFSDFLIDNNGEPWEEHFTVEYQYQSVTFILKTSDHLNVEPAYTSYTFVVRLLW